MRSHRDRSSDGILQRPIVAWDPTETNRRMGSHRDRSSFGIPQRPIVVWDPTETDRSMRSHRDRSSDGILQRPIVAWDPTETDRRMGSHRYGLVQDPECAIHYSFVRRNATMHSRKTPRDKFAMVLKLESVFTNVGKTHASFH